MTGSGHGQPIATQECERAISLPIRTGMTGDDVATFVEALTSILDSSRLD